MKKNKYWIQEALKNHKKGSLHRQLGIPQNKTLPKKTLAGIAKTKIGNKFRGRTVTSLLKKRVVLARTLSSFKRRKNK